jgi:hypothetical protein
MDVEEQDARSWFGLHMRDETMVRTAHNENSPRVRPTYTRK